MSYMIVKAYGRVEVTLHDPAATPLGKRWAGGPKAVPEALDSVALVHERTIPTERPPPVGEVSASF